MYGTYLDGVGDLSRVTIQVVLPRSPASRQAIVDIPHPLKIVQLVSSTSIPTPDSTAQVQPFIYVADCAAYRSWTTDMPFPRTCTGGPQQLVGESSGRPALAAGTALTLATVDGHTVTVRAPASRYGDFGGGILLSPKDAPWVARAAEATVIFQASASSSRRPPSTAATTG